MRVRPNHTAVTRRFTDVAKMAIRRMDDDVSAGAGKAIYEDNKFGINRYCIPFLGKYMVDNIDYKVKIKRSVSLRLGLDGPGILKQWRLN